MWWIWFCDWIVVPVGVLCRNSSSSCNLSGMYLCWPLRTSVIEMTGSAEGWCQWLGLTVYIWRIGEWGSDTHSWQPYSSRYPLQYMGVVLKLWDHTALEKELLPCLGNSKSLSKNVKFSHTGSTASFHPVCLPSPSDAPPLLFRRFFNVILIPFHKTFHTPPLLSTILHPTPIYTSNDPTSPLISSFFLI